MWAEQHKLSPAGAVVAKAWQALGERKSHVPAEEPASGTGVAGLSSKTSPAAGQPVLQHTLAMSRGDDVGRSGGSRSPAPS